MTKLSPIALFTYNRIDHTIKVIDSLLKNNLASDSILFIFSDGAKSESELDKVSILREYLKSVSGFNNIEYIFQEKNLGLANSILNGVDLILKSYDKIIVLEDDIVVNRNFLKYMNEGLNLYSENPKVASIHAYTYPISPFLLPDTFFLKGADCWGWGTWKRAWSLIERDGSKLKEQLKNSNLIYKFDLEGSYPYYKMLCDQIEGKNNSWAIRWHASMFLQNMYSLYPKKSLVENIGLDNSGTHTGRDLSYKFSLSDYNPKIRKLSTDQIYENKRAKLRIINFFKKINQNSNITKLILKKIKYNIKNLLNIFSSKKYWFKGNYSSFEEALKFTIGYDSNLIFEKVKNATQEVLKGKASFERDSVLFYKENYSSPILFLLFYVISKSNNTLRLIDFGGSLGSSYYQYRKLFSHLNTIEWSIIEQPHFVEYGNTNLRNKEINFFYSIDDFFAQKKAEVILFSSVLPYIANWKEIILQTIYKELDYIIIDRTPYFENPELPTRIMIEEVPKEIYNGSYPAIFFNQQELEELFSKNYIKVFELDGNDKLELKDTKVKYKATLFLRIK